MSIELRKNDDGPELHLPGLWSLDTTTLCGYTWPCETVEGNRPTCKICLRVLGEMRKLVKEHCRIKLEEP